MVGGIRVDVRWAEVESAEGRFDEAGFERCQAALDACRARGRSPVVALQGVDPPRWLGPGFWLRLDAPSRFETWAAAVSERLGDGCRRWITLVEPNDVAWRAWVTGCAAPHRVGAVGDLVRALDHMVAAHVGAHAALHRRDAEAMVGLRLRSFPVYELERLLVDVLLARSEGVSRHELRPWLLQRRQARYQALPPPTVAQALYRRLAGSAVPLDQALPLTVAAVYEGAHCRPLEVV